MRTGKKTLTAIITTLLILTIFTTISSSITIKKSFFDKENKEENYALIIGVGIYKNRPEKTVGSIHDAENLYDVLTQDENWDEENIKLITGKDATKFNIIKGFLWLDRKEDENDKCLVYYSSHGGSLNFDIPPFDEEDGKDEVIATYKTLQNKTLAKFTYITDDEINFFLNRLESRAITLIIECCHAGGFDDSSQKTTNLRNLFLPLSNRNIKPENFKTGFATDIKKQGRVILMSTQENLVGYSIPSMGGLFTISLIESLENGLGDLNNDGSISSEEAFNYIQSNYLIGQFRHETDEYAQKPKIYDDYPGEFNLVKAKYDVDLFETISSETNWKTTDHTNGTGGNLWHISEENHASPTKSFSLSNENLTYNQGMNNSIISNNITVGNEVLILFNYLSEIQINDRLYFEMSSDNWETYNSVPLQRSSYWSRGPILMMSLNESEDQNIIQIRFRFESEKGNETNSGYIYIDDIIIHSTT